jgi:hypothetical protein
MNRVLGGLTEEIPEVEMEGTKRLLRRVLASAHEESR